MHPDDPKTAEAGAGAKPELKKKDRAKDEPKTCRYYLGQGDPGYQPGAGESVKAEVTQEHRSDGQEGATESVDLRYELPSGGYRHVLNVACGSARYGQKGRPHSFEW